MSDEKLDEAEREVIEMIEMIHRDYQKQIKPYIKQLARIRALRPAPPIVMPIGDIPQGILDQIKIVNP